MITRLILSILLYFGWVLLYLSRNRIKKFFLRKKKSSPASTSTSSKEEEIMGKTKTQLSQIKTNNDRQSQFEKAIEKPVIFAASNEKRSLARIDNSELDAVFSDSSELLELDLELEYEDSKLTEEEALICFVGDDGMKPATGIQYDEMENLIQVMQRSSVSPDVEQNAVDAWLQLNQTELFQQLIAQIEDGKQRVSDMLDKYHINAIDMNPANTENRDNDFQQFEINDFL